MFEDLVIQYRFFKRRNDPTDGWMDERTDGRSDGPFNRDARTLLKTTILVNILSIGIAQK